MLIDSIKMGFNDLKKRKFRTALTALSISIGTMLLIIMFGLGVGIQKNLTDKMKGFGANKIITVVDREPSKESKDNNGYVKQEEGKKKKLDLKSVDTIKKIDGVSQIVVENQSKITGVEIDGKTTSKEISLIGRDANYTIFTQASIDKAKSKNKNDKYNPILAGKSLEKNDDSYILIGERYLKKIGINDVKSVVGKEINLKVELPQIEGGENKQPLSIKAKISGVIDGNIGDEGYQIIASPDMVGKVQEYYTGEKDYLNKNGYTHLSVECKDVSYVSKVNSEINTKLVYGTYASLDNSQSINSVTSLIKGVLIVAGIIVLLVAAIGVINTMTMTVYEKTKSIGIMKAQGASRNHITIMFLSQAGVLGFLGGVLGSILAVIASTGLDKFVIEQLKNKGGENIDKLFYTPISAILGSIAFSILVCVIAGMIPAKRAAKLNPVDSLRYE